jgi:hypothetical protein
MAANEELQRTFIELVARQRPDFGQRYYEFCEARTHRPPSTLRRADFTDAIAATGLAFRYDRGEDFFQLVEPRGGVELRFHVIVRNSTVELGVYFVVARGLGGRTLHGLAHDLELARGVAHTPRYPRARFSNREDLDEVLAFGVALYHELGDVVLAHDWSAP